jgi:hypothetical protein
MKLTGSRLHGRRGRCRQHRSRLGVHRRFPILLRSGFLPSDNSHFLHSDFLLLAKFSPPFTASLLNSLETSHAKLTLLLRWLFRFSFLFPSRSPTPFEAGTPFICSLRSEISERRSKNAAFIPIGLHFELGEALVPFLIVETLPA